MKGETYEIVQRQCTPGRSWRKGTTERVVQTVETFEAALEIVDASPGLAMRRKEVAND